MLERELKVEREKGKQLEEENARRKEKHDGIMQLEEDIAKMKGLGLKVYRFAIMDLKNKGANNPNSSLHDDWQNMLAQMEEDCTAFGLEEEAMKELWDLAEQPPAPDIAVLQEPASADANPFSVLAEEEETVKQFHIK